jgi:hypothetical protein
MWPYDHFNQYSGLINEFEIEIEEFEKDPQTNKAGPRKKIIFLAKNYDESQKGFKRETELRKFLDHDIKIIEKEIINEYSGISDKLRYRLKSMMPKDPPHQEGDINFKILGGIIQASLVILDITPTGKVKKRFIFNENVMAELGLALAWKMPEQVICLWDTSRFAFDGKNLPFDIQNYFVKKLNFCNLDNKNDNLKDYIEDRIKKIEFTKSIFIKNIITKLDSEALELLRSTRGLIFTLGTQRDSVFYPLRVATLRHLLNLGIFRIEIFLPGSLDYGYYLTDFGRVILIKLGVKELYCKRFAEFIRVSYWMRDSNKGNVAHKEKFDEKKAEFRAYYDIDWDKCDILLREVLNNNGIKDNTENVITMFENYDKKVGGNFKIVNEQIVKPWEANVVAETRNPKIM